MLPARFFSASINEWSAVFYRIFQAAAMLVTFRIITLEYGPEMYGFVSLFMTFAAYLIFFDFGIVSFMRTEIPHAYSVHGERYAHAVTREGLKGLLLYAGCAYTIVLAALYLSDRPVEWLAVLIRTPEFITDSIIRNSILSLLIYSALMVTGNLIFALLSAKSRQYRYYCLMIAGSFIQVAVINFASPLKLPVNYLFTAFLLTGLLPLLGLIAYELYRVVKSYDTTVKLRTFNGTSTSFFIVQIGGLIVNNIDVLIVAHLYSMHEVAIYSTMKLLIQLPISLHGSYIMQAWPQFSAMRAGGKLQDIQKLLKNRLRNTLLFSITFALLFFTLAPVAMRLWSNGVLSVDRTVVAAFSALLILYTYSACYSILIFSFNYIKPLAVTTLGVIPVLYGLSFYGKESGFGIESVVFANTIVQLFGLFIGMHFYHFKMGIVRAQ
jgi:O-antigen/teichoic acid export membrane protein